MSARVLLDRVDSEGDYVVRVTLNKGDIFDEGEDRYPNVNEVRIHVPDPRKKVTVVE